MTNKARILALALLCFLRLGGAEAKNLHTIDQDKENGFAIYRLGDPDRDDVRELCELGVKEIMVLSGDAEQHEYKYAKECPTLKVVYNVDQESKEPLSAQFLASFDQWVKNAQEEGKAIAFRCSCGCHRTGRLAAYYRMKYNGFTLEEALDEMKDLGKWMVFFPHLRPQVRDLKDYIDGRPCRQSSKHCVRR